MKFSAGPALSLSKGFTLVELLVVIAIMSITGIFTLANFRSFGEDQNLKNALLDVQNQLRSAQSNATASEKCSSGYGASWMVTFDNVTSFRIQCTENWSDIWAKKTFQLGTNITMQFFPETNCPDTSRLFSIAFAPLTGKVSFLDNLYRDKPSCSQIKVTFLLKNKPQKSLIIEKGGRIYEQ